MKSRTRRLMWLTITIIIAAALIWFFALQPSNERNWQPDVARTAWAEQNGNILTIHNVRNCVYRTETDYDPRWEDRTLDLSKIQGIDLFLTYWGSPYIAHPILSFVFTDGSHIAFSIETRKEVGEQYSSVKGFFRAYELIYIPADERDVIRLRTNYRKGEEVYLFRTSVTPERARSILLDYVKEMNSLHQKPQWYNALTRNCTTNIRVHAVHAAGKEEIPWDWRILTPGLADKMLFERGNLKTGNLSFEQLKNQAHINDVARSANDSPDFSRIIREGRAGF